MLLDPLTFLSSFSQTSCTFVSVKNIGKLLIRIGSDNQKKIGHKTGNIFLSIGLNI